MNTKTVLFSALNATGHINALLGIADRLKEDHEYRTVFLLLGPTTLRTIEEHGHELMIINLVTGQLVEEADGEDRYAKQNEWNDAVDKLYDVLRMDYIDMIAELFHKPDSFGQVAKDMWANHHAAYAAAIASIKPHLIVLDTWYVPPCILTLKHTPWVYVTSGNPYTFLAPKLPGGIKPPRYIGVRLFSKEERERMRQEEPPNRWLALLDEWKRLSDRVEDRPFVSELFDKVYRDHGVEPMEQDHVGHHSPHLNVYVYPKEIDYDQEDDLFEYPKRWFRCDTLIRLSVGKANKEKAEYWAQKLDEAMRGKNEMIYFSLGTLASGDLELMRHYLDMFREDKGRLYVISKGPRGDQIELADNMIGANYLPQTFFLKRAHLAIIHGGNNSTTECLYHGVPMIVLPCFGDQPDNAQRMEDLKLGKRFVLHKCQREDMMGAIEELLADKKLVERVSKIGEQMRARDDARKLSAMLKKLAEEGKLDDDYIEYCRNHSFKDICLY